MFTDGEGKTALHWAASNANGDTMKMLLVREKGEGHRREGMGGGGTD